jgi:hypothetical protein
MNRTTSAFFALTGAAKLGFAIHSLYKGLLGKAAVCLPPPCLGSYQDKS